MPSIRYGVIKLQPNARISEHINIGIVAFDPSNNELTIVAPDSLGSSKIKNWFPSISTTMIAKYIYLMRERARSEELDIEEFIAVHSSGLLHISSFKYTRVVGSVEETIQRVYNNTTDLRITKPVGRLWSVSKIKSNLQKKLERRGLLGTKAEIDPDPVRIDVLDMPAFMHLRWLNGVNQYVRIVSLDKSENSSANAIQNSWNDVKAVIEDCQTLINRGCAASIVLQRQESQAVGELAEIADVLEYHLQRLGVSIYSTDEIDALVNRIDQGRELYLN